MQAYLHKHFCRKCIGYLGEIYIINYYTYLIYQVNRHNYNIIAVAPSNINKIHFFIIRNNFAVKGDIQEDAKKQFKVDMNVQDGALQEIEQICKQDCI